jgi:hypothetical protein
MAHGGHDAIELIAAVVLVLGGALFTIRAFRARPAPPGRAAPGVADASRRSGADAAWGLPPVRRSVGLILAGLSGGAAVIHLVAAPTHYLEIGELGAGFLIAAVLQGAWIRWCLAGPSRRTALFGIALNGAIVLAWAWTRVVGLPIGPFAGGPEPIGLPDGASVVFELLLVAGLVPAALGVDVVAARGRAVREIASIAVVPVVGLVLVVTSLATVAVASGLDHGTDGHASAAHVGTP